MITVMLKGPFYGGPSCAFRPGPCMIDLSPDFSAALSLFLPSDDNCYARVDLTPLLCSLLGLVGIRVF